MQRNTILNNIMRHANSLQTQALHRAFLLDTSAYTKSLPLIGNQAPRSWFYQTFSGEQC